MPINAGFGETWWLDPQGDDIGDAGENYQYDVAEAKALFAAAGSTSFEAPMHFSSTTYTTVVPYYDIVREALPAMLGEAGVTVNLVPEEYGQYIATTFAGQFDGFAWSLESVFSDIGAYWGNMFCPRDAGGAPQPLERQRRGAGGDDHDDARADRTSTRSGSRTSSCRSTRRRRCTTCRWSRRSSTRATRSG